MEFSRCFEDDSQKRIRFVWISFGNIYPKEEESFLSKFLRCHRISETKFHATYGGFAITHK